MNLTEHWYIYQEDQNLTDNHRIASFLESLPGNFEQFFNNDTSNLLEFIPPTEQFNLSGDDFWDSFMEAKELYSKAVKKSIRVAKIDRINSFVLIDSSKKAKLDFDSAGFSPKSLKVKFTMVDFLWRRIYEYVQDQKMRFMNFIDPILRTLVGDLMDYLKIIIDSLRALFPIIEVFAEMTAVIKVMLVPQKV